VEPALHTQAVMALLAADASEFVGQFLHV